MKRLLLLVATVSLIATAGYAHDLFLKLDTYFLQPNSKATVRLMNGTFQQSDGAVARERLRDLNLTSSGGQGRWATMSDPRDTNSVAWRTEGKTAIVELQTLGAGTYLVGASTHPREIELKAADFNDYLKHDGIPDTLAARTRDGELNKDVRERYSKHVTAIFQVGDKRTDGYNWIPYYSVAIVPQQLRECRPPRARPGIPGAARAPCAPRRGGSRGSGWRGRR